jgi:hypothetical protein
LEKVWKLMFTDASQAPARVGERVFDSENAFLSAAAEALANLRKSGLSATLPTGEHLSEDQIRLRIGAG